MRLAFVNAQVHRGMKVLQGRHAVGLQSADMHFRQGQADGQAQAAGRRARGLWRAAAEPLQAGDLQFRQAQCQVGAWAPLPAPFKALNLQIGDLQAARSGLPAQAQRTHRSAAWAALPALDLQAGHLTQGPGRGPWAVPHHDRRGQSGGNGSSQEPPAPAPLRGRGGHVGRCLWRGFGGVAQKLTPKLRCRRPRPRSSPQAQSTLSGPTGLRQRRPRP